MISVMLYRGLRHPGRIDDAYELTRIAEFPTIRIDNRPGHCDVSDLVTTIDPRVAYRYRYMSAIISDLPLSWADATARHLGYASHGFGTYRHLRGAVQSLGGPLHGLFRAIAHTNAFIDGAAAEDLLRDAQDNARLLNMLGHDTPQWHGRFDAVCNALASVEPTRVLRVSTKWD